MQKIAKNSPSAHHRTTLSGYMSSQYGELRPTSSWNRFGSVVWGNPANFNQFGFLASLLQWHRWMEANQTLQDVWPSPELVHYVYIFRGSCPLTEFCQVQNSFSLSCLGFVTAQYSSSGRQPDFAVLSRGCHLYSAGRPSRWALAHILVTHRLLWLGCNVEFSVKSHHTWEEFGAG